MSSAWRLRGYTVDVLLGSGSTGDVWRARVAATGEAVALKRMPCVSADQVRHAETEAALLTALDHPHLVRLHALAHAPEHVVLVLDLADGGSLADLIRTRGRLTPGEVITAVAPVAAALAYLHDEGVVHGDVSAANILFTAAGIPMLADVGVARLAGDDSEAVSTPAYVDPGVAAGCVPGAQSDIFMLAAVALHALTGAPPWPGPAEEALALAAAGVLADVDERLAAAGVSPAMARVLGRALAVDPHRRGTAADLALDLRHSGQPVAVELLAGRARTPAAPLRASGPRHAAAVGSGRDGAGSVRDAAGSVRDAAGARVVGIGDPSRPEFERPALLPGGAGVAPPTRMVGPRPRPVIPRPRRWSWRPRVLGVALGVVLVALVAAAGTVWASNRGLAAARRPTAAAGSRSPAPVTEATRSPAPVTAATRSAAPVTVPASARPDWPGVLAALDGVRAQAYATRNPTLLARVYVAGPLLRADTGSLTRIVPVGCGLLGVRTRYADVHAVVRGARVLLTATAVLAPSRLTCHAEVRSTARGAGPTVLHLELTRTSAGLRIAALHLA